jgi:hypothetical protein
MTATLSPSIHEGVIVHAVKDFAADPAIKGLHDAVKATREACNKATDVTEKVLLNEMKSIAQRHRDARDAGFGLLEVAGKQLDEAIKAAEQEMNLIKAKIKGPPAAKDAVSELRSQFMLTKLASKKPEERRAILDKAVAEGRDQLVAAVLSTDPWMSEMTVAEINMVRHAWAKKHYAGDMARPDRLERVVDDSRRIGSSTATSIS